MLTLVHIVALFDLIFKLRGYKSSLAVMFSVFMLILIL